jgi:hypothetical protein
VATEAETRLSFIEKQKGKEREAALKAFQPVRSPHPFQGFPLLFIISLADPKTIGARTT